MEKYGRSKLGLEVLIWINIQGRLAVPINDMQEGVTSQGSECDGAMTCLHATLPYTSCVDSDIFARFFESQCSHL